MKLKPPSSSRSWLVLAAGAILFYQLMLPPVVALADNGDFAKVIGRFAMHARNLQVYEYASTKYYFSPDTIWDGGYHSVEVALARVAIFLNSVVTKDGSFDIRCIGIVHSALFLAALWFFAPLLADKSRSLRWAMHGLVLFVFCDVMYVNSLNSFYMDVPAYLFLLLTIVFYLRVLRWRQNRDAVALMLCSVLLAATKTQHEPLVLWIALLFLITAKHLRPIPVRAWYGFSSVLVITGGLMAWKAQPADYALYPLYNVTFEAILPHSQNVQTTLAELGLDDSYRFCIGKKAYLEGSGMEDPEFLRRFGSQYSYAKLGRFYIRRPDVAFRTMVSALTEAGKQRDFGNFDRSTGFRPSSESRAFAGWSNLKRQMFQGHGSAFLYTFITLAASLGAFLWRRRRDLPAGIVHAGICLIAAAFTEMGIATLSDSMDIPRHSMIFLVLFDVIALSCVFFVASVAYARFSPQCLSGSKSKFLETAHPQ